MSFSCAVLAGGKSSRFGSNKFLADLCGKPLILRALERLSEVRFDDIFVVVKDASAFGDVLKGYRVVEDSREVASPIVGVETALSESKSDYTFIVSGDMPFIEPMAVEEVLGYTKQGWDVVVPYWEKGYEPLFAAYYKGCLPYVKRAIRWGEMRANGFYYYVRVLPLKRRWNELTFFNVNTPEDLKKAEEIMRSTGRCL